MTPPSPPISGLIGLKIRTSLSNILLFGDILFQRTCFVLRIFEVISLKWMKSLTNFLLTEDKFMPGLHLRQSGFTYSACGLFAKHRERKH